LNKAEILDKMECSILATGKSTKSYEEGERKGRLIEDIVDVQSVDWVTRAGAGGKAVALTESEPAPIQVTEDNMADTVVVETPVVEVKPPVEPVVTFLTEVQVLEVLKESRLPEVAQKRLTKVQFSKKEDVLVAVEIERAYLQEVTESGKVFGMGESQAPPEKKVDLEAVGKAKDAVIEKYFGPSRSIKK